MPLSDMGPPDSAQMNYQTIPKTLDSGPKKKTLDFLLTK